MDTIPSQARMYLAKLNTMSDGDPEVQISMHDVGDALGLDKTESGMMAETLFVGGYAELKTLSGGIGITAMGLKELGVSAPAGAAEGHGATLGQDRMLGEGPLETVTSVLEDLKAALPGGGLSYDQLEEALMDIKTIEVQLLSPHPKTRVVREVFRSLAHTLSTPALSEMKIRLDHLVTDG